MVSIDLRFIASCIEVLIIGKTSIHYTVYTLSQNFTPHTASRK